MEIVSLELQEPLPTYIFMKWVLRIDSQVLYRARINQQVVSVTMWHPWPVSPALHRTHSPWFFPSGFWFIFLSLTCLLPSAALPQLVLSLLNVRLSVCRTFVKRSPEMRHGHGEAKKISSSLSWPRCYLCPGPSPASWTRPQSSGWPSATCTCALSPARETHPGAHWWRETATAAKVSTSNASVS